MRMRRLISGARGEGDDARRGAILESEEASFEHPAKGCHDRVAAAQGSRSNDTITISSYLYSRPRSKLWLHVWLMGEPSCCIMDRSGARAPRRPPPPRASYESSKVSLLPQRTKPRREQKG